MICLSQSIEVDLGTGAQCQCSRANRMRAPGMCGGVSNAIALLPAAQLVATVSWITVRRVAGNWGEICVLRMKMKEKAANENEIGSMIDESVT